MQCTCAILSPVPCPGLNMFPRHLIKDATFEKIKVTEHDMCFLIFPTTFVRHISRTRKD